MAGAGVGAGAEAEIIEKGGAGAENKKNSVPQHCHTDVLAHD